MAFSTLSILIFLSLFPNLLYSRKILDTNTTKTSKLSLSLSIPVYNKIIYKNQQPNSSFYDSKLQMLLHDSMHEMVFMVGIGSNRTSTPMLMTELVIDTGSSFTWVQGRHCHPCHNQGDFLLYDGNASQTYDPVYCEDDTCKSAPDWVHPGCGDSTWFPQVPCSYTLKYYDNSSISGIVARETFYFPYTSSPRYDILEYVPFGVGLSSSVPNNIRAFFPGVAGFNMYRYGTFLKIFGAKKFSHCFPRNKDVYGVLSLGKDAKLYGDKVRLLKGREHYTAKLTDISIAGEAIIYENDHILPSEMIFDTGASYTVLLAELLEGIEQGIKDKLRKFRPFRSDGVTRLLCYRLVDMLSINLDQVTKLTFGFSLETEIDVFSFHMWTPITVNTTSAFCLNIRKGGVNLFGNDLMRDVNIGYSLDKKNLAMYFNHQRCG